MIPTDGEPAAAGGASDLARGVWLALRRALHAEGAASVDVLPALLRLADAVPADPTDPDHDPRLRAVREALADAVGAGTDGEAVALAVGRARRAFLRYDTLTPPPPRGELESPAEPEVVTPADPDEDGANLVLHLDAPLAEVGVDDAVVEQLAAHGLVTVGDVLLCPPVHEEQIVPVFGAGRPLPLGRLAVGGRVRARITTLRPGQPAASAVVLHGAGRLVVRWAGAFTSGDLVRLELDRKVVVAATRDDAGVAQGELAGGHGGRAWCLRYDPRYASALAEARAALAEDVAAVAEPLPPRLVQRHRLSPLGPAIQALIERGRTATDARRRVALLELVIGRIGLATGRYRPGGDRAAPVTVQHQPLVDLERRGVLGPPTPQQLIALELVKRDLQRSLPAQRVLFGPAAADVEHVARLSTLLVTEGRTQVLVISSEPQAATVRYEAWRRVLDPAGVSSTLWLAEPRRSDREAVRRGEVGVVFATEAVWEWGVDWRRLGLVVAAQQGVYRPPLTPQRGVRPHHLVICATPVGWSCLTEAWPGWDVTEVPAPSGGSGMVWAEPQRADAYRALAQHVREGGRAVVAFPMTRHGADLLEPREAEALAARLREEVFGDVTTALFHGAQGASERQRARDALLEGRVQVVVATSMLEIDPVDVDGLHVLIEHADRMDVQRLVQWRRFAGAAGCVHYVVGAQPRAWGARAVVRLAAGEPDAAVVSVAPEGFVCVGPTPRTPATVAVDPAVDAELVAVACDIVGEVLRADPTLRDPAHARLAGLAHAVWSTVGGDNPLPAPRPATPRKRRRRRRRK